jgi:hypothetical protein
MVVESNSLYMLWAWWLVLVCLLWFVVMLCYVYVYIIIIRIIVNIHIIIVPVSKRAFCESKLEM